MSANAERLSLDMTTVLLTGFVCFLFGVLAGVFIVISAQVRHAQDQAAAAPLRPSAELLGEVTTVMPGSPNDRLATELRKDDDLRKRNERDAFD